MKDPRRIDIGSSEFGGPWHLEAQTVQEVTILLIGMSSGLKAVGYKYHPAALERASLMPKVFGAKHYWVLGNRHESPQNGGGPKGPSLITKSWAARGRRRPFDP